jgi:DNA-binding response OmpR family regulator
VKDYSPNEPVTAPRRILIAEDDGDARAIVAHSLLLMGHEVIGVEDGQAAIEFCRQELPDLAILDYVMPKLNGVEVCQALKKLEGGERVPVLMLTARDGVREKVSALIDGVDDYLTKPFDRDELSARIESLLRIRDLMQRLHSKNEELSAMQERLVQYERQSAVTQLAGTAAHQLGQPLSAILLNCYLVENLPKSDPKFSAAVGAIKSDVKRMVEMIEKLRRADASAQEEYCEGATILKLP